MVSNTNELLPEPETPVNTVSRRFGNSTLTSLRLFSRAPCTRITSWLSAACSAGFFVALIASAQLLDAHHVARGIAHGAVAHAGRLLRRLRDHLGLAVFQAGLDLLEGAVEVLGGQQKRAE